MRIWENSELLNKNRNLSNEISKYLESEKKLVDSLKRKHNLTVHLMKVREEEQKVFARNIHDELGQTLAALLLQVSLIAIEYKDQERLVARASEMEKMIKVSINAVQRICSELRPAMLDILGLADAMEWQSQEFRNKSGISCNTAVRLVNTNLDSEVSASVFHIFREALANVIQYSGATHVQVNLVEKKSWLTLSLCYDAPGFDTKERNNIKSLSMSGISERIIALGGKLRICAVQRNGTALIARIPVSNEGGNICPSEY